ncbi:MAG: hypothetical protein ACTHL8_23300 [Burkholderiaceae bacterium]
MIAGQKNAPAVDAARGEFRRTGSADFESPQSRCVGLSGADVPRWKRVATLRARAVLASAVLVDTTDDAGREVWLLTIGAATRSFTDLGEVEAAVSALRGTWA